MTILRKRPHHKTPQTTPVITFSASPGTLYFVTLYFVSHCLILYSFRVYDYFPNIIFVVADGNHVLRPRRPIETRILLCFLFSKEMNQDYLPTIYLSRQEEHVLTYGVYYQIQVSSGVSFLDFKELQYDRRQAACMIDAMMDQLQNCHLTVDYKITLSRRVAIARRRWFAEYNMNFEDTELRDLLRYACRVHDWSADLGNLFETNARMIRQRMSRIRELHFNRRQRELCLE
ncbi:hypothetical protein B9Z55_024402 [Caenorhabditis nigoni]|uniref:Uncharacterized protein n=1 Tax=Caenorhabditis nigoni TaxID=1611254 RepID=A0A2G5SU98_9PELO|nr:hypothetical protein B9Z55_024402 [Caenorhabditis nigoni]